MLWNFILWVALIIILWPIVGALSYYAAGGWETTNSKENLKQPIWGGWLTLIFNVFFFILLVAIGIVRVAKIFCKEGPSSALYYLAGYRPKSEEKDPSKK